MSFNVPTDEILKQSTSGSTYKLEYDIAHLLPNIASDVYELRVALPEGATILNYSTGYAKPSNFSKSTSYSYLDFLGRPTLVFKFNNYLPSVYANSKLTVEYTLEGYLLWIEPVYLVVGLLLCFALYLVFSKMDLSFGSDYLVEKHELEIEARERHAKTAAVENQKSDKQLADKKRR